MTGPRGAVVTAEDLIATRFAARFIDVTGQTRALANLAGMRRSRQRGRGVEFDEVRAYAAGDDVRAIDWRVTARSGTPPFLTGTRHGLTRHAGSRHRH